MYEEPVQRCPEGQGGLPNAEEVAIVIAARLNVFASNGILDPKGDDSIVLRCNADRRSYQTLAAAR